jgi:hypothetical protein
MPNHLKTRVGNQMFNIFSGAGVVIVDANYIMTTANKTICQMRAQKSGSTSD